MVNIIKLKKESEPITFMFTWIEHHDPDYGDEDVNSDIELFLEESHELYNSDDDETNDRGAIMQVEDFIDRLDNPNELVSDDNIINVFYQYPFDGDDEVQGLGKGWLVHEVSPSGFGFTQRDMLEVICERYKEEFFDFDDDVGDNPFKIWGHSISDLVICGVKYHEDQNVFTLIMAS